MFCFVFAIISACCIMGLESYAILSISNAKNTPPVYPVGPILNLKSDDSHVGSNGSDDQRIEIS